VTREQMLVLRFDDLARESLPALNSSLRFLGLSGMAAAKLELRRTRKHPPINPATAERLRDSFAPYNAALPALGFEAG
jgi:hypothetical protein